MKYLFEVSKLSKLDKSLSRNTHRVLDLTDESIQLIVKGLEMLRDDVKKINDNEANGLKKMQMLKKINDINEVLPVIKGEEEFVFNKLIKKRKQKVN